MVSTLVKNDHKDGIKAHIMSIYKIRGDAPQSILTKSCLADVWKCLVSIGGKSKKYEIFRLQTCTNASAFFQ